MFKKLLFSIPFVILFITLQAQNVRLTTYNSRNNGLSNNLTKAVSQDSLGFIWVATDEGLSRFDGISFQNFIKDLPSNYVKSFLQRRNKTLLAATDMGIVKIISSPDTAYFQTIIKGHDQLTDSTVLFPKLMFEDSHENIWITDNQGIVCYKNNRLKRYNFNRTFKIINYQRTFSITETSNGNLFAFSPDGFTFYLDRKTDEFVEIKDITQFKVVNFAIATNDNSILIATSFGMYELTTDKDNKEVSLKNIFPTIDGSYIVKKNENEFIVSTWSSNVYTISKKDKKYKVTKVTNLSVQRANWLYFDTYKNVFISTDEGLILMQNTQFLAETNKSYQSYINSMRLLPENEIWATNYGSILKIDYKDGKIITSEVPHPVLAGDISCAVPSKIKPNSYWISTNAAMLYFVVNNKIERKTDLSEIGKNMFNFMEDNEQNIWGCVDGLNGVVKFSKNFERTIYDTKKGINTRFIVIKQRKDGTIFGVACTDSNYLYVYDKTNDRFINCSKPLSFQTNNGLYINDIAFYKNDVLLATTHGILKYDGTTTERLDLGTFRERSVFSIATDRSGNLWFANGKGILKHINHQTILFDENNGLSNLTATYRCFVIDSLNRLWIGTSLGINFSENLSDTKITPSPVISNVYVNKEKVRNIISKITFIGGSYLTINYFSLSYPGSEIIYQYKLSDDNDNWIDIQSKTELILPDIPTGKHNLQIRAKQQGNFYWSLPSELELEVIRPWFLRWWAFILYILFFINIVYVIVKINSYRLIAQKRHLEQIVKERTNEVVLQKNEILEKNEELLQNMEELQTLNENIETQKNIIEETNSQLQESLDTTQKQNIIIEKAHKNIIDSINYAKRIQTAILPNPEFVSSLFPENFVLYKPRNIVSGDFYFIKQVHQYTLIAVADCTGHGVPGAFMSMLGLALLNEIVRNKDVRSSADVLNQLRDFVKIALHQTGQKGEQPDGMDIAFCTFDSENLKIQFAGANIPLWIIKNEELRMLDNDPEKNKQASFIIYNSDRQPIGAYPKEKPFTNYEISLEKGDQFYIFSDGYTSQFGGEKNSKLKIKYFQEIISLHAHKTMQEQGIILDLKFEQWRGDNDQVDDVLVVGLKV